MHFRTVISVALSILVGCSVWAGGPPTPLGTAFTYQGVLKSGGSSADGVFDLEFRLFDVPVAGTSLGTVTLQNQTIEEGQFTVSLDFGGAASIFDGNERWMEIAVEGTTLSPRQRITPAPYALFALSGNQGPPGDSHWQLNGSHTSYMAGNVGIGTATPSSRLDIQGSNNSNILFGRSTGGGLAHNLFIDGNGNGSMQLLDSSSVPRINLGAANSTYFNYGNVGIGTTSPATPLHIARDLDPVLILQDTGTASQQVGYIGFWSNTGAENAWLGYGTPGNSSFSIVNKRSNGPIRFLTNNTDRMSIGFDGRIAIGTTTPAALLHVVTSTEAWAGRFSNTKSGGIAVDGRTTNQFGVGVYGQSVGADSYDFFASGTGVHYGQSSSIRWKHNIEPIADPLTRLDQIRGVYFDWDAEHGGRHDVGMIAEEVGKVLPEIVAYEANGVDASGMDYSTLTPLLVEAVKALRAEKDAEIASLRAELADLKALVQQLAASRHEGEGQ